MRVPLFLGFVKAQPLAHVGGRQPLFGLELQSELLKPPSPSFLHDKVLVVQDPDKTIPFVIRRVRDQSYRASRLTTRTVGLHLIALIGVHEIVSVPHRCAERHLSGVVGFGTADQKGHIILRNG